MKISKSLLQVIAVAVTVASVSSACKKDDSAKPKEKTNAEKPMPNFPDGCPACGMG